MTSHEITTQFIREFNILEPKLHSKIGLVKRIRYYGESILKKDCCDIQLPQPNIVYKNGYVRIILKVEDKIISGTAWSRLDYLFKNPIKGAEALLPLPEKPKIYVKWVAKYIIAKFREVFGEDVYKFFCKPGMRKYLCNTKEDLLGYKEVGVAQRGVSPVLCVPADLKTITERVNSIQKTKLDWITNYTGFGNLIPKYLGKYVNNFYNSTYYDPLLQVANTYLQICNCQSDTHMAASALLQRTKFISLWKDIIMAVLEVKKTKRRLLFLPRFTGAQSIVDCFSYLYGVRSLLFYAKNNKIKQDPKDHWDIYYKILRSQKHKSIVKNIKLTDLHSCILFDDKSFLVVLKYCCKKISKWKGRLTWKRFLRLVKPEKNVSMYRIWKRRIEAKLKLDEATLFKYCICMTLLSKYSNISITPGKHPTISLTDATEQCSDGSPCIITYPTKNLHPKSWSGLTNFNLTIKSKKKILYKREKINIAQIKTLLRTTLNVILLLEDKPKELTIEVIPNAQSAYGRIYTSRLLNYYSKSGIKQGYFNIQRIQFVY